MGRTISCRSVIVLGSLQPLRNGDGQRTPGRGDVCRSSRRPSAPAPRAPAGTDRTAFEILLSPERQRKLNRIVFATLGACGIILLAAAAVARPPAERRRVRLRGDEHPVRGDHGHHGARRGSGNDNAAAPPAAAPAATPDAPQTGTIRLVHPLVPGKVWLDGQKVNSAAATVACGKPPAQGRRARQAARGRRPVRRRPQGHPLIRGARGADVRT